MLLGQSWAGDCYQIIETWHRTTAADVNVVKTEWILQKKTSSSAALFVFLCKNQNKCNTNKQQQQLITEFCKTTVSKLRKNFKAKREKLNQFEQQRATFFLCVRQCFPQTLFNFARCFSNQTGYSYNSNATTANNNMRKSIINWSCGWFDCCLAGMRVCAVSKHFFFRDSCHICNMNDAARFL